MKSRPPQSALARSTEIGSDRLEHGSNSPPTLARPGGSLSVQGKEQAAAYRTMIAYTGKWRVEGNKFITKVDVAWNPAWVGTEQARFWRVEARWISAPTP